MKSPERISAPQTVIQTMTTPAAVMRAPRVLRGEANSSFNGRSVTSVYGPDPMVAATQIMGLPPNSIWPFMTPDAIFSFRFLYTLLSAAALVAEDRYGRSSSVLPALSARYSLFSGLVI